MQFGLVGVPPVRTLTALGPKAGRPERARTFTALVLRTRSDEAASLGASCPASIDDAAARRRALIGNRPARVRSGSGSGRRRSGRTAAAGDVGTDHPAGRAVAPFQRRDRRW